MKSRSSLSIEFTLLFLCLPILLALDIHNGVKLGLVAIALLYFVFINIKQKHLVFKSQEKVSVWSSVKKDVSAAFCIGASQSVADKKIIKNTWLRICIQFLIAAKLITLLVVLRYPDDLFKVILNKPSLWLGITFVYVFLSVIPQEYLYRVFFFSRYAQLFKKPWVMVGLSTFCFCIAHLMFNNSLVLMLTLVGGLIFSLTYLQSKNYTIIVVEHSLYGLWLFTVGLGDMLAFPS